MYTEKVVNETGEVLGAKRPAKVACCGFARMILVKGINHIANEVVHIDINEARMFLGNKSEQEGYESELVDIL